VSEGTLSQLLRSYGRNQLMMIRCRYNTNKVTTTGNGKFTYDLMDRSLALKGIGASNFSHEQFRSTIVKLV
jgi:hypothetical protein